MCTPVMVFQRVTVESSLTGSSFLTVAAKATLVCGTQSDTVCLGLRSMDVNGRKYTCTVEGNIVFFSKCYCQVALPCHPT